MSDGSRKETGGGRTASEQTPGREPVTPEQSGRREDAAAVGPSHRGAEFERLLAVMDRLRSPGGCPWDAEQTHESLLRYLVEETYEVVEAVESPEPPARRRDALVEELGDVLLQVVFHSRIGEEHEPAQRFDVSDVVAAVTDKLVRRHPAVFGEDVLTAGVGGAVAPAPPARAADPGDGSRRASGDRGQEPAPAASPPGGAERPGTAELAARWDAVKRAEKPQRTRIFDGIPPALPALALGEKALSKARRHGVAGVPPTGPEPAPEQREAAERELGDELLRRVAEASAHGLDAERALRGAVRRFVAENDGPLAG
ncbi:MazG nucleotide pyrophosphohydrolase domain-containing protein [Kocuria tytonis]|uniref:NTP pyrophosphohydrolase MazG-like domain-containing protein n=1 Tax=Kocuria tytonis TaxID=2054280 RepID=A0A495A3T6_9MICC|nr:MazG nucleotide pyrophosphohydrolase domain-containing protein [Kocuria tytonis]RKQ34111.1 hypothetical protein C1C97_009690 [Kocuria tytonis]